MTGIEFEIKAAAPTDDALRALLAGLRFTASAEIIDRYFDQPERRLFRRGVFLRVRNGLTLEIKYNADTSDTAHYACLEKQYRIDARRDDVHDVAVFLREFLTFPVDEVSTFSDLFAVARLDVFIEVAKTRAVYVGDGVEVAVDDVQGLGRFVEIEVTDTSRRNWFVEWAASHGLCNITTGYVELLLRKRDFNTYMTGRYLLQEDRLHSI